MQIEHHPDPVFIRNTREYALGTQSSALAMLGAIATLMALPLIAALASNNRQTEMKLIKKFLPPPRINSKPGGDKI